MNRDNMEEKVRRAVEAFERLSPEAQARHRQAQRESWARAMAPCEHGIADWEECEQCRANAKDGEPHEQE